MTKLMTEAEHKAIYGAIAESVVAEPEAPTTGLDPRVQRGVDFLDEHHPGWADKINLAKFDLSDSSRCVVGQVFGEYEYHVYKVFGIQESYSVTPEEESFGVCFGDDTDADDPDVWIRCEDDWRVAIAARQGGKP